MRLWPLIIDSQPAYLDGAVRRSIVSLPLGQTTVFERVRDSIAQVTPNAPMLLAPSGAGADYVAQMADACPGVRVVRRHQELAEVLAGYEVSDVLLVVDPRCLPVATSELRLLTEQFSSEQQVAHHLIAFATGVAGTKEQVNIDGDGEVRSIHRFYEPVTWPFLSGVAASLVPMSSGIFSKGHLPASLADLREAIALRGIPCRDLPIAHGAWVLSHDQGLLAASEHLLASGSQAQARLLIGGGQRIHASVRTIGPVAVHANAVLDENAIIVGPAVIGPGAHVGAGALVAHALIGTDAAVAPGTTVRDLAWFARTNTVGTAVPRPRTQSFEDRLARIAANVRRSDARADRDSEIRWQLKVKRAADAAVAALGLLFLSPLLALVAALIKLDSPGSPFYGCEREGVGGRVFRCWKFRTMFTNAHAVQHTLQGAGVDGPHFKMDRDPRVTRVGRWLRVTNIDELPQLFNVLCGTMSLVGPRPSPFRENQICVPWREARLSVRPGMTGLWQLCRQDREAGDFHQWIEYDLLYVRHLGIVLDLKILLATFLTLGGQFPVPASWMIRPKAGHADLGGERWVDVGDARPSPNRRVAARAKGYAAHESKAAARSA